MSKSPIPEESAGGFVDFAAKSTVFALRPTPTREGLERVLAKLKRGAGTAIESGPCASCESGFPPTSLVSELVPIRGLLDQLCPERREALKDSATEYIEKAGPFRDGRLQEANAQCPFLQEGNCILGSLRPFMSKRKLDLAEPEIQKAFSLELGHAIGLYLSRLDHHRVELGLALPKLLKDNSWVRAYLNGEHVFWEEGWFPPFSDPVIDNARMLEQSYETPGAPPTDPAIQEAITAISKGNFEAGMAMNPNKTVLQRMFRLRLPNEYRSEEEIDYWRSKIIEDIREFVRIGYNYGEAFDALRHFNLFSLAYQGREVKSIVAEVGDILVTPIVAGAVPDLVRPIERRRKPGRFRVGYLSNNLRSHNGGFWSLGWMRNHAEDIESFAFLTEPKNDWASSLFREAADHYYHVPSDIPDTARFIKSLDLDVLIFTDIGMSSINYQYAGMRLARVQATAWGHPVTSGLSTIDYFLSSELMEPSDGESHYTEKLVRLPGSGLFYKRYKPSELTITERDFGIDEDLFVLVPQNVMKLPPREDELFHRVSQTLGVPLYFMEGTLNSSTVTKERLASKGIQAKWIRPLGAREFRRLLELADVILDIPAWNGGNTVLEALSFGKPVVTMPGPYMRGRHSLAFLKQAKMEALIASDANEYIRLAADKDAQQSVITSANFDGPFEDEQAVEGLDSWIRAASNM